MAISEPAGSPRIVHIRPTHGMRGLDFAELWQYRDLFYFMVWRGIKIRYAQSVVGVGWAIVQPVAFMIVFTVVFGNMAKVDSNGVPYAIFSFTALVPWTFFSTSFMEASTSLTQNRSMLTKIYFPRIVMPLSAVFGRLIDFSIAIITEVMVPSMRRSQGMAVVPKRAARKPSITPTIGFRP